MQSLFSRCFLPIFNLNLILTKMEKSGIKEDKEDKSAAENSIGDKSKRKDVTVPILVVLIVVMGGWIVFKNSSYSISVVKKDSIASRNQVAESDVDEELASLAEVIVPSEGYELPLVWGDLGKKLVDEGVIDKEKFEALYAKREGLSDEDKKILYGEDNGKLTITSENSGFILNMLWALGLGNKNEILEKGEMSDPKYGGAGKFASTGGWSLAKGDPMSHYSKHNFITLSAEQQAMVARVSNGIYRPCCGNSTHFPDCNHGMAMLSLLELMASQGASEKQMYDTALKVNSYWFPDTYMTIARYMKSNGIEWKDVDAKTVLGVEYSSGQGYAAIQKKVNPVQSKQNGGCGA